MYMIQIVSIHRRADNGRQQKINQRRKTIKKSRDI